MTHRIVLTLTVALFSTPMSAQTTRYYDQNGMFVGSARQSQFNNETKFYDRNGNYQGIAKQDQFSSETRYYDQNGSYQGLSRGDGMAVPQFGQPNPGVTITPATPNYSPSYDCAPGIYVC